MMQQMYEIYLLVILKHSFFFTKFQIRAFCLYDSPETHQFEKYYVNVLFDLYSIKKQSKQADYLNFKKSYIKLTSN